MSMWSGAGLARWAIPGVIVVIAGTGLAIWLNQANVERDLASVSSLALNEAGYAWAGVAFSGRDATLTGTATDPAALGSASDIVAAIPGVRSVASSAVLAPSASPYPFAVTRDANGLTLSGGVPDAASEVALLALAGAANDSLDLMSGYPDLAAWRTATEYALMQSELLAEGEVRLEDLTLTLDGRAAGAESYAALNEALSNPPAGVTVGSVALTPPMISPYTFSAGWSAGHMMLIGNAPSEADIAAIAAAAPEGTGHSELTPASGAPEGFTEAAVALVAALSELETGEAHIADGVIELTGQPLTGEVADAVAEAIDAIPGYSVALTLAEPLQPPLPYTFTAQRSADGAVVLRGSVPTVGAQQLFEARAGDNVTDLTTIVPDAPELFGAVALNGLAALNSLEVGTLRFDGTVWSLGGRAVDEAAQGAAMGAISQDPRPPFGWVAQVIAPEPAPEPEPAPAPEPVSPYVFSATKSGGAIDFAGYVPIEGAKAVFADRAPLVGSDTTEVAPGAPEGFGWTVLDGISALKWMTIGIARFDGERWTISGRAEDEAHARLAEFALDRDNVFEANWDVSITYPEPKLAEVSPYVFTAIKWSESIDFSGYVPSENTRGLILSRAGAVGQNQLQLAAGAPESFGAEALRGVTALRQLRLGLLRFDGATWSLAGQAEGTSRREAALGALGGAEEQGWVVSVRTPDSAPVVKVIVPPVSPYVWIATKSAGVFEFAGYVPTEGARQIFNSRAGRVAIDSVSVAPGAPDGFATFALNGIAAMQHLRLGTVRFDGNQWVLIGRADTAADREAALAALTVDRQPERGWSADISVAQAEVPAVEEPAMEEPVAEAPATVTPYVFMATKSEAGVTFSGHVPTEGARRIFATRAGTVAGDTTEIAPGAPAGFGQVALNGISALGTLEVGTLRFDGTVWSLSGRAADQAGRDAALAAIGQDPRPAFGWVAQVIAPEPAPEPEPEPEPEPVAEAPEPVSPYIFSATKSGGQVDFAGYVPTEGAKRIFALRAGTVGSDTTAVAPGAPENFGQIALNGLSALAQLRIGRVSFDGTAWTLQGVASDQAAHDAAVASIGDPQPEGGWQVDVQFPRIAPAPEVVVTPEVTPEVAISRCKAEIANFSAMNTILFESGSARLAASSGAPLEQLATWLATCPAAEVHVEGHTDADGSDDLNLALSLARAEAVVDRLVELGVSGQRLYAVGYGETLPIASNETNDGKRRNRRIVFTIVEPEAE